MDIVQQTVGDCLILTQLVFNLHRTMGKMLGIHCIMDPSGSHRWTSENIRNKQDTQICGLELSKSTY